MRLPHIDSDHHISRGTHWRRHGGQVVRAVQHAPKLCSRGDAFELEPIPEKLGMDLALDGTEQDFSFPRRGRRRLGRQCSYELRAAVRAAYDAGPVLELALWAERHIGPSYANAMHKQLALS
jgi:hypothetical protein